MLVDLKKDGAAEAVTTLRLNEILTQLEAANNKFEEVKEARVKDRQTKHLQVKTPEMRSLADSQLEEIQDLIRATGIIAATDPESAVLLEMVNKKPDEGESDDGNLEFVPVEK